MIPLKWRKGLDLVTHLGTFFVAIFTSVYEWCLARQCLVIDILERGTLQQKPGESKCHISLRYGSVW